MLLSLSGRTNTQHSPSIAPSPISLWRVSNFLVTGWHGFIIPVMCVNLASAINVSSPFSRSYFAHRYSIFCELLLGTALTLHAKVKTRLDSHNIKTGYFTRGKCIRLSLVTTQVRCKHNNYFFSYVKMFFLKKSFDDIFINPHRSLISANHSVYGDSVEVKESTLQAAQQAQRAGANKQEPKQDD